MDLISVRSQTFFVLQNLAAQFTRELAVAVHLLHVVLEAELTDGLLANGAVDPQWFSVNAQLVLLQFGACSVELSTHRAQLVLARPLPAVVLVVVHF